MNEEWKPIRGYDGRYEISNLGRIRVTKRWVVNSREYVDCEKIMNPTDNGHGYAIVGLRKNAVKKNHYVHRLVADAFVDNPHGYAVVNHIDHNTWNNMADNLEWCTQEENVRYSADRMRKRKSVGYSKTGEQYIYKRGNKYRLVIDRTEYPASATLEEAVRKRDAILKGVIE